LPHPLHRVEVAPRFDFDVYRDIHDIFPITAPYGGSMPVLTEILSYYPFGTKASMFAVL
jgi:hypothetical protein